jgi:tRNA1Val (adenine37-N6)-methyltransferase
VIGLGLCLANPCSRPRVLGVDVQAGMVEAATENARRLGLADLYAARKGDVRQYRKIPGMGPESFDLVLANPPYRLMGQGRPPRDEGKRGACFEYRARLKDFLQAAAFALTNKGRISLVYMVERLPALLHELHECRLEPKEMRLVHAAEHKPAGLALLTARKNVRPGLAVHSPLFLDRPKELEAFCPLVAGAEEAGGGRLAIG